MSIIYLSITSTDNNGNITDYHIKNIFVDETEMVRYFASSYRYDSEFNDYQELVHLQRLCKDDVLSIWNCNSQNDSYSTQYLRSLVLYDDRYDRFLDIRNYQYLIEKNIYNAISYTQYQYRQQEERHKRRLRKQGKTHHKRMSFKGSAMFKDNRLRSCRYGYDCDGIEEYNMMCKLPKAIRPKLKRSPWEDDMRRVQNNWKDERIKHQWEKNIR